MTTLFVSDLHLTAERPDKLTLFETFLAHARRSASALYILGDLFEVWLGDDDDDPAYRAVIAALAATSDAGVALFFAHGNRDFLCGSRFARQTGATLLADYAEVDLDGQRAVVTHGDLLCTRDVAYQRFRRVVRHPLVRGLFLATPLRWRQHIAQGTRRGTQASAGRKAGDIMDVEPAAVRDVLAAHDATLLIHGHTHRPAIHDLEVDGRACRRIVLGDWYTDDDVVRIDGGRVERLRIGEFLAGA